MRHVSSISREHVCPVRHANSLRKEHNISLYGDAVGVAADVLALLIDAYDFVMSVLETAKGDTAA